MQNKTELDAAAYWAATLAQRPDEMAAFFAPDATVRWPNTNELFTAAEFIRANCEYPGSWEGEIERLEQLDGRYVLVGRVFARDRSCSHHVVSFIQMREEKICRIDEYWSEDGPAPLWRQQKQIGRPIAE